MNMKKNIIRWYHTKDVVSRTLIVKFLKSIKIDIPTFNGRHVPQLFLDWTQQLDKYFTWYDLTELRKVKFAAMKLTGQANQYWTNLVKKWVLCGQEPYMKDELRGKYVLPNYYKYLLDIWRKISQGNKFAKEYVNKLDEFLNRYNIVGKQSDVQVFSQFCVGLRIDLEHELCKCGVTDLKVA